MLTHRPQTPQPGFGSITLLQKFTPHFKILDPRLIASNFKNWENVTRSRGVLAGTPYDVLDKEAPPERGTFFRLQVYERGREISQFGL